MRWRRRGAKGAWKLLFIDVKKAHTYADCNDPKAFIELPPEDCEKGMRGELKRWLYGMRGAAQGWEQEYGRRFVDNGFVLGETAPR